MRHVESMWRPRIHRLHSSYALIKELYLPSHLRKQKCPSAMHACCKALHGELFRKCSENGSRFIELLQLGRANVSAGIAGCPRNGERNISSFGTGQESP